MAAKQEALLEIKQESIDSSHATIRRTADPHRNKQGEFAHAHRRVLALKKHKRTNETQAVQGVLTPLALAAETMNEQAYLQACATINWQERTPEEFIQAIQYAFAAGAHMAARQLANLGSERHPQYAELQRTARILAPARVIASKLPPIPAVQANRDWLVSKRQFYRGKWVALKNGELLGDAETLPELTNRLAVTEGIFFTQVI